MANLINDLAKYFTIDDINIDNVVFKLFYKGAVLMFFMGSLVGVLSQYFGEPINCDFKGIDGEMASDYCWIHGSSYIPPQYQPHMKCIVDLEGIESADDAPDTSYYQWVTFMMMFQAGLALLPFKIWSMFEGGLMESFGLEGKTKIMVSEAESSDENGIYIDLVLEKYVKYFKSIIHHNNWYFAQFVFCELLNVLFLFLNFSFTDSFLNGKFRWYGWDVISFYQLTREERRVSKNPFCSVFPTEVSCTVPNVGAGGKEQHHNGLCVLSQNVINEKVYLVVWFYLVFLKFVSVLQVMYRLSTIFFDKLRFHLLHTRIQHTYDPEIRKSLEFVMSKCFAGDWFVLCQLSKNSNRYFMRQFIVDLAQDLKRSPKRSLSVEVQGKEKGR